VILKDIAEEHARTVRMVAEITGQPLLTRPEDQPLKEAITLKEPYLDPLNTIQVQLLAQYRNLKQQDQPPPDLLERNLQGIISSIEGIATGLGTTG
jgi:phosphoenolpyruvate carboxylase